MEQRKSVLILGGSGQAGAGAAAVLRRWHPALPLTIAGRDLARAQRVADELGGATATTIDLSRDDLGLPDGAGDSYSAVVATVWDDRLHGLRYAQRRGLPYLSLSNGLVDIAPEVVAGGQRAGAAPILLASHYFGGLLVLATLELAKRFAQIDTIRIGAVLDETDTGGPAAIADLERWSAATPAGLVRRDGVFTWVSGDEAQAQLRTVDGTVVAAQAIAILDVPSLALATGAPNVRVEFAVGESAGRRRGESASTEVRIDLAGTDPAGAPLRTTHYLVHPDGQRPLTAVGVALGVEGLLGLRGAAVAPGLHMPEALIDPGYAVERLVAAGAEVLAGGADRYHP